MPAHQHLCLMAASVAAVSPARPSVAVVGAGVSGLNCAKKLQPTCDVTVFEASDGVGGRNELSAVRRIRVWRVGKGLTIVKVYGVTFVEVPQPDLSSPNHMEPSEHRK